ncbi:MAG: DNA-directed RNA polymerase subunit alpha C-terminal domain-containing protein [Planctomycetales bacterium]
MATGVTIDIKEALQAGDNFGWEQADKIRRALSNSQYAELKQEYQVLQERLASGETAADLLRSGVVAYLLGMLQEAEQFLNHKSLQNNGTALYYLGHVLTSLERHADAEKKYDEAEKAGADAIDCKLARAGAVRAQRRLDEAEKLVQSSAPQGATRADYSFQLGCILSDRGDTYGAVEYFERAVDMDPYHTKALFWLAGENMLRGNDDEAIRLYERALSRPPLYLSALVNLGLLYEDSENYPAAAYCFRRVLEAYPNHARARLYLKDIDAAADMYYDEEMLKNQSRLKQILEIPVTDFELSVRARNCLQKMGIRNLGDLTRVSETELLSSKNFGDTSLDEIRFMLESRGLKLGQALMPDKPMTITMPGAMGIPAMGTSGSRDMYRQDHLSPQEQALMARPVSDLNLSVRARKCMSRLGITTLGELVQKTQDELLESKNFGVTSLTEVRQKLTDLGLKLRGD